MLTVRIGGAAYVLALVYVLVFSSAMACPDSAPCTAEWTKALKAGDVDAARAVCEKLLQAQDASHKAEGDKCMASVLLAGKDQITLQADDVGGGVMKQGYRPSDANKAIAYLNKAIALTPKDVSIHQGRLYLLMNSFQQSKMPGYLEKSIQTLGTDQPADIWMPYLVSQFNNRQYTSALAFLKVLVKAYPDDSRLIANMGALYAQLEQDDKAIKYMKKAVEMTPNDPLNNWNLGRLYYYQHNYKGADTYYGKAIALNDKPHEGDSLPAKSVCIYADFVAKEMNDKLRACTVAAGRCPKLECN